MISGEIHRVLVRGTSFAFEGLGEVLSHNPRVLCRISALHFWGNYDVENYAEEQWSAAYPSFKIFAASNFVS